MYLFEMGIPNLLNFKISPFPYIFMGVAVTANQTSLYELSGERVQSLTLGFGQFSECIAFNNNGSRLAFSNTEGIIFVFRIATGISGAQLVRQIDNSHNVPISLSFNPFNDDVLAIGGLEAIEIINYITDEPLAYTELEDIHEVSYNPTVINLLLVRWETNITPTQENHGELTPLRGINLNEAPYTASWNPLGNQVAATFPYTILISNLNNNQGFQESRFINIQTKLSPGLAYINETMVIVSNDANILIIDTTNNRIIHERPLPPNTVISSFSTGYLDALAGVDTEHSKIHLWRYPI